MSAGRTLLAVALAALRRASPRSPRQARPAAADTRRPPEHPRGHDRRQGGRRRRADAERQAPARRAGDDLRRRGRLVPALLPGPGDVHHRPVRPQPRRRRQLLPLRLVRDEGPRQHPAGLAAEGRLPHGADRQVAQRLRRARRPRRGPGGVRHLARAARRLGLRLLQLRHEPERPAARPGATPTSRASSSSSRRSRSRKREQPGVAACSPSSSDVFGPGPVQLLGHRGPEGLLARRDRQGHRGPRRARRRKSKKPFFIWWAPAAPHREDVATTLMGRPGPTRGPRRATRRESKRYMLPRPPSFNEADISDKPSNLTRRRAVDDRRADPAAAARLPGPRRLAARGRRPRQAARRDPARAPAS